MNILHVFLPCVFLPHVFFFPVFPPSVFLPLVSCVSRSGIGNSASHSGNGVMRSRSDTSANHNGKRPAATVIAPAATPIVAYFKGRLQGVRRVVCAVAGASMIRRTSEDVWLRHSSLHDATLLRQTLLVSHLRSLKFFFFRFLLLFFFRFFSLRARARRSVLRKDR